MITVSRKVPPVQGLERVSGRAGRMDVGGYVCWFVVCR